MMFAALDPARSPGELALALLGVAAVLAGAGYLAWLCMNGGRRKD